MGKKWTNETKILHEKKKELGIKKLTIAQCKQYPNNPYQLIFDGSHVAFFPDWNTAFSVIDEVFEMGVGFVRDKNKRVLKNLETKGDQMKCYRCNNFKNKDLFKWGHKYCNECALEDKKEYYYLNKYEISSNKYSCFENYLSSLINKRDRKDFFDIDDLMNVLKKQDYKCAITKQDFELVKGSPKLPSIDRIKPKSEGGDYSLDNIQIVWHGVNAFKSNWTMGFLLECSKHIVENNN
jgi:hypothetical protein